MEKITGHDTKELSVKKSRGNAST